MVFLGRANESQTQHGESSGIAVDPDETDHSINGVIKGNNVGEGEIQKKKSRRQIEKSPQGTSGNRQDEETTSIVDLGTESTEFQRASSPQFPATNHESTFPRELPHSEERIDEADPGPGANSDIYESDHEVEGPLEESSIAAQPSSRPGLIGSVAASIGNVVRGAAGRAPS